MLSDVMRQQLLPSRLGTTEMRLDRSLHRLLCYSVTGRCWWMTKLTNQPTAKAFRSGTQTPLLFHPQLALPAAAGAGAISTEAMGVVDEPRMVHMVSEVHDGQR